MLDRPNRTAYCTVFDQEVVEATNRPVAQGGLFHGNFRSPYYGVALNPIVIERKALSHREAVTTWYLRMTGVKYNHVDQYLGTNTHRVGEVFRGEMHFGSRQIAAAMVG